ncbi:MAG: trypsin-like peptidase domain-containing protein [Acidobacteriota bacterium]|nr:trypsin-like peptidase domain-containing protein [Acidobacteriota bacterium]
MRPHPLKSSSKLLCSLWIMAGAPLLWPVQAPEGKITTREAEAIQRARKGARPRPVAPRAPLLPAEQNAAKLFRNAKQSVVYITSIVLAANPKMEEEPAGTGSGFVWDDQGHVVTNQHVINTDAVKGQGPTDEADILNVTLANGRTYKAQVIGRSLSYDIAVLQVFAPLESLKPLPLGKSTELLVGQTTYAIGNPYGLDHTLTSGVVSALNREISSSLGNAIRGVIQTDAAINPGNSGGPLLDSAGRLIGMNTSVIGPGNRAGIGFAIPVDTLNRVVPLLIARGQLEPVYLGFTALIPAYARALGVTQGVMVSDVEADSPAARAGLRPLRLDRTGRVVAAGDILLTYQGTPIQNGVQLFDLLELEPPKGAVVFDVLRDGKVGKIILRVEAPKELKKGNS